MRLKLLAQIFGGFIFLSCSGAADATTYYVRKDGGTLSQCTGLADASYPGSGTAQACAYNHPFWALPIKGNPSTFQGGDTLIISPGSYRMGYDAPNQKNPSSCASNYTWDCHMQPIPSGPDANHPTRILGKGWDQGCSNPPQLYGVERAALVINLRGSNNVDLQCLDITDHDSCTSGQVPGRCNREKFPYGEYADVGVVASDSTNVLLKNL
ncbi:MAG: hypothetical protein NUV91_07725, partial [Candidatus Omnitrophica bacterium]|nr:hypothetical protein [Candidatus Omnitrophota bacterium]